MMADIERQISQSLSNHEAHYLSVIGHGIYLVEISQFQLLREKLGESLEHHYFTDRERNTFFSPKRRLHFFAGRLAGKNAVVKALHREKLYENSWRNIDIQKLSNGQPLVVLKGKIREIAQQIGIQKWLLSISHTSTYAVASSLALGSS